MSESGIEEDQTVMRHGYYWLVRAGSEPSLVDDCIDHAFMKNVSRNGYEIFADGSTKSQFVEVQRIRAAKIVRPPAL